MLDVSKSGPLQGDHQHEPCDRGDDGRSQETHPEGPSARESDARDTVVLDDRGALAVSPRLGHHVQTVTGLSEKVRGVQSGASESEQNALQVRMELQADCYAGIWAHHADRSRQLVEAGDIQEALDAANAVGDDTIQRRVRGNVNQETFTHGSGAQCQEWFRRGFSGGRVDNCDTFE